MWNPFEYKLLVDDRAPHWLFRVGHYDVGLIIPKVMFTVQLLSLMLLVIVVGNLLSALVYYGIICRRGKHEKQTSLLVGLGIVIPISLLFPFLVMDILDVRSAPLRMTLSSLPISVCFRTLEALFGDPLPPYVSGSWNEFRHYYGFVLHPLRDKETHRLIPATPESIMNGILTYVIWSLLVGSAMSFLIPYSFEPWIAPRSSREIFVSFHPAHLANNFVAAILTSWTLNMSLNGGMITFLQLLTGVQFGTVMDGPLYKSKSPADFWGRRWNRLVHRDLKNGVYKPIRLYGGSKVFAALATFLASGLLHEYLWLVVFYVDRHQDVASCHVPPLGKQLLFFSWNGVLLLIEYGLGKGRWMRVAQHVPSFLTALFVIVLVLPAGHLFVGDLIIADGYFSQMRVIYPLVVVRPR